MSPTETIQAVNKLRQLAAAGNPKARALLAQLEAAIVEQVKNKQAVHALDALDDLDDEVVGEEEGLTTRDEIELADDIARWEPTADQLAHKAMLRQAKIAKENAEAPYVSIAPASAYKSLLGNQISVSSGEIKDVARWVGSSSKEALPVTVTLGQVQPLTDAPLEAFIPTAIFRPYAVIQWGTQAFMNKAEVDIGRGVQFTLGANTVIVQVAMAPVDSTFPATATMQLDGMLSFYTITRTTPLIRTSFIDYLASMGSVDIAIPNFAVELLPVQMQDSAGSVQLDFLDVTKTYLISTITLPGPGTQITPIPLYDDAVFVRVTNTGPNTQSIRLPWSLGI